MGPRWGQGGRPEGRRWQGVLLGCLILAPLPASAVEIAITDAATLQYGNVLVLSALACGGVALAIAAGLWALAEQRAARRLRRSLRMVGTKTKAAVGERDALLVWGRDGGGLSPIAAATSFCSRASRAPMRWRFPPRWTACRIAAWRFS